MPWPAYIVHENCYVSFPINQSTVGLVITDVPGQMKAASPTLGTHDFKRVTTNKICPSSAVCWCFSERADDLRSHWWRQNARPKKNLPAYVRSGNLDHQNQDWLSNSWWSWPTSEAVLVSSLAGLGELGCDTFQSALATVVMREKARQCSNATWCLRCAEMTPYEVSQKLPRCAIFTEPLPTCSSVNSFKSFGFSSWTCMDLQGSGAAWATYHYANHCQHGS